MVRTASPVLRIVLGGEFRRESSGFGGAVLAVVFSPDDRWSAMAVVMSRFQR